MSSHLRHSLTNPFAQPTARLSPRNLNDFADFSDYSVGHVKNHSNFIDLTSQTSLQKGWLKNCLNVTIYQKEITFSWFKIVFPSKNVCPSVIVKQPLAL